MILSLNRRKELLISPVGQIPPWVSQDIAAHMHRIFRLTARITPLLKSIDFAYDADRNQYHSTRILEVLDQQAPESCAKVLAITKEDLFIPILTHVYGEAQLGGKACIVSISRLLTYGESGNIEKGHERMIKESAHELGHTFDLRHCEDPLCMMHYCRKIEDVDHKSDRFCRYCSILLNDAIQEMDL